MYGCESWTVKKAECRRIDDFELWCWRRLLRVPWTARRSNQSILKEISPRCSLEGMMLNLKLPILWPPHAKSWLIGKDSDAGRNWGQEEKGTTEDEMDAWHHGLDGCESEWTPGVGDGQGGLACCDSWGHEELDTTKWLNWTELMKTTWERNREKEVTKPNLLLSPFCHQACEWNHLRFSRLGQLSADRDRAISVKVGDTEDSPLESHSQDSP